ncbi:hypothetical protein GJ496_009903 [Pomphorhynchus laevis]|nr:hypothetical protein GJ496_009903 [Pomphorhynchus laevis]
MDKLLKLHETLCHPGIRRLFHYVRTRNLQYLVEDVNACVIDDLLADEINQAPTENSDTLIQNPHDYKSSEYPLDYNRKAIVSFRVSAPTGNFNTVGQNHSGRDPLESFLNSDTLIQNHHDYESSEYPLDYNRKAIVSFRVSAPTGNSNTVGQNHSGRDPSEASPIHALDEANVKNLVFPIEDSEVHVYNPLRRSKGQRRPPQYLKDYS